MSKNPLVDIQTENMGLVRWFFERLNAHDLDAMRPYWTDRTVEYFPDRIARGTDQIVAYFKEIFLALPDWKIEEVAMAADGQQVFARWHLTGTHSGRLMGLAGTGKRVAVDGVDHFVFEDGKLASNTVFIDQMEYSRSLGLLPAANSPLERAMKSAFNARTRLSAKLGR